MKLLTKCFKAINRKQCQFVFCALMIVITSHLSVTANALSIRLSEAAKALSIRQTIQDQVAVRDIPDGKVVAYLPIGSKVRVVEVFGDRAYIAFQTDSASEDYQLGWADSTQLLLFMGGDNCNTDWGIDAEVCLTVNDQSLQCHKTTYDEYYGSCKLDIGYELSTNYEGDDHLEIDVECEAKIEYWGNDSYYSHTDSKYNGSSHSLWIVGSQFGGASMDFYFSDYTEVYRVEIELIDCKINSVES